MGLKEQVKEFEETKGVTCTFENSSKHGVQVVMNVNASQREVVAMMCSLTIMLAEDKPENIQKVLAEIGANTMLDALKKRGEKYD